LPAADHERADDLVGADERHDQPRQISRPQHDLLRPRGRLVAQIGDLHRLALVGGFAHGPGNADVVVVDGRDQVFAHAVGGAQRELVGGVVMDVDRAGLGAGELGRLGHDRVEHGLEVERRVDCLADLAQRPQLLHRLPELVRSGAQFGEQANVLDGDDGLAGEVRDQLDLLVGERPHLLAVNHDRADQLPLLEHWYAKQAARAGIFDKGNYAGTTLDISLLRPQVGGVDYCFGFGDAGERGTGNIAYVHGRLPPPQLDVVRGCAVHRDRAKGVSLAKEQIAELCLAESRRVRQHGLEHGLQVAGRARDDAQHLGGGGLLLQRFAQFVGALLDLLFQTGVGFLQLARHVVELIRQPLQLVPGLDRDALG